jgi:hypothetical protein
MALVIGPEAFGMNDECGAGVRDDPDRELMIQSAGEKPGREVRADARNPCSGWIAHCFSRIKFL